jgi:hypothetical protein
MPLLVQSGYRATSRTTIRRLIAQVEHLGERNPVGQALRPNQADG